MAPRNAPPNRLLERLGHLQYGKLAAELEHVPLMFKETLYEQCQPIEHVFFVTSGVVSLMTVLETGEQVEGGTVGREGMVGVPAFLGAAQAPGRAICQVEGTALRMKTGPFLSATRRLTRLHQLILLYTNALMAMLAQSAACNRAHVVEARMARCLLMTHDRVDTPEFPLTQEFLGQMLGVRRPAVNIAGRALQRAGLIRYTRGKITICDRRGLERAACSCYERVRQEFERAFGA